MKVIRIDNSKGYISLAEAIVLQAVKDYSRSYSKVLKDPTDKKAEATMQKCEDYIMTEPLVAELISDPLEFLYKLDLQIEADHERRMKKCRR